MISFSTHSFPKQLRAFTLVEILVVLGLFSGIATITLGSLFNAQAINKRLQETQSILDNVNLSAQTIARDIRFGSEFYATTSLPEGNDPPPRKRRNCVHNPNNPCTVLFFQPSDARNDDDRVAYYVKNGILYKNTYPAAGSSSTEQMTANDVTIRSVFFFLQGSYTSNAADPENEGGNFDYLQPAITFLLSGSTLPTKVFSASTTFNFELTLSPRELDNK